MCGVFILHIVGKTVVRCQTLAFVIDLHESVSDLEINLLLCVLIWIFLCGSTAVPEERIPPIQRQETAVPEQDTALN